MTTIKTVKTIDTLRNLNRFLYQRNNILKNGSFQVLQFMNNSERLTDKECFLLFGSL